MLISKLFSKMFKSKFLYIAMASMVLASSCSTDNLNLSPEMENVSSNFFLNEEQLNLAVSAAYSTLQYTGQYQIANLVLGELPSDNTWDEVPANDGGNAGQVDLFNMTSSNTIVADSWADNFKGIQQCNIVITRAATMEGISEEKRALVTNEMKFLRGLMYFNLVRIFGDVQLVLEETTDPNAYFGQERTPKADVYAQIVKDLTDATALPAEASEVGRATKYAAHGVLARVYLTLKDYNNALTNLNAIEASGKYKLLSDVNMIFDIENENNEEIIFDVQFQSGLNGNSEGSDAYRYFSPSSVSGGKGHSLPTSDVYSLFEDTDARKSAYFIEMGVNLATNKIKEPTTVVEDGGSNTVVVRYADVLLMIAECSAQNGDMAKGNAMLEMVRVRANASHTDLTSKEDLLDAIATERRKELVSEGHRWFDLIRTDKALDVMNAYFGRTLGYTGVVATSNNLVQPIPLSQIDTDASTVQNPGYN